MKYILSVFLCFAFGRVAFAQTPVVGEHDEMLRYGVNASLDANLHSADFQTLPGIPSCCTGFTGGSGFGPSLGIFAEKPFSKTLALALRASYMSSNALLSVDEPTKVNIGNVAIDGTFRHSLDAKLSSIGLEPLLVTRLFGGLAFEVGARAALSLTATYAQKEEIVSPANSGVFVDNGMRTRNVYAGTIPNAATFGIGLMGGVRYELPMNASHTLLLAPEVMYVYTLTPVATGLAWHANTIRAGVSLVFAPVAPEPQKEIPPPPPVVPAPPPPVVETKPLRDTSLSPDAADKNGRKVTHDDDSRGQFRDALRIAHLNNKPAIAATLAATGVDATGAESAVFTIRVEEFISTEMQPMLPYIFFDENSSAIPVRYHAISGAERDTFQIKQLFGMTTLPVYYNVLNVMGRRLTDDPTATITLTGCNDDRSTEKGNRNLSQRRAETVRNYLRDTWGIAEKRMPIVARDLPATPSNPDSMYGIVENRRVEITSDKWPILAPVISNDTLRTATPPIVRWRDTVLADAGEKLWTLNAAQKTKHLRAFGGAGMTPNVIDWDINADKENIPRAPTPLDSKLDITDSMGQQYTADAPLLQVEQITLRHKLETRVADHTVDKFSLILFDFDKADVSANNKRLCAIIRQHIEPTSTVHVDGFSDGSGDSTRNWELSQSRAANVSRLIGAGNSASTGQRYLLFPSDSPEGRCYCRTVNVTVETPLAR